MENRILALLMALVMMLAFVPAALADEVTGTGTAKGFGGDVTVSITLTDGVITNVTAEGNDETDGIGKNIIAEWPQAFVDANGIVDTYTGATFAGITRAAFIEAASAALTDAGVNPDDFLRELEEEAAEDVVLSADVVIVGAGGAGMRMSSVKARVWKRPWPLPPRNMPTTRSSLLWLPRFRSSGMPTRQIPRATSTLQSCLHWIQ